MAGVTMVALDRLPRTYCIGTSDYHDNMKCMFTRALRPPGILILPAAEFCERLKAGDLF